MERRCAQTRHAPCGGQETSIGGSDLPADALELRLSEVDAIFFDFGDTLATLTPSKEELFIQAARSVGLQLELESVKRAYQVVDFHNKYSSVHVADRSSFYENYNQQLAEALGISSHFSKLNPALIAEFRNQKRWALFSEVPETLRSLRAQGILLALVANWDSNLSQLVEKLGIRQEFSAVISSQAARVEKPNPAIFILTAAELNLSVETKRILYVGNEYRADVMGARAAGLTPVLIDRHCLYKHADCPRFTSLVEWLKSME
jgi:putative hydrolase of the HAD superfamily